MKKFLSIAALSAAAAGIAIATYTVFNKKKNQDENIDDVLYTDGFDDEFDTSEEEGSYFDVNVEESSMEEDDSL